ncbi:hypothetical protein [Ruegeria atlantica]|uniref:hypothetical protein n=1 Tax=Ruegeria atlantica TaxID=81569 RepID=UPI00147FB2F6|nr:hypothetical protein [Ruegeria atlantica]
MRFLASLIFIGVLATAANSDVTSRNGGPSKSQMLSKGGDGGIDGVAFFRPVLSGVLYRSGFKGGDKDRTGLSEGQRETLCGEGFSTGFYADFGKNTEYGRTSCGNGSFDYQSARSSRPDAVMASIHEVIKNPGKGPVLVHCMWGVHSSGALSAMALVQFCGWTEERAKEYWNDARNGAPCSGGCDQWIDSKFSNFSVDPKLKIFNEQQAAICPK